MPKILLLFFLCCCTAFIARGQENFTVKGDSLKRDPKKTDTVKYVNLGKIAGRKAVFRSMLIPGWGQIGNGLNVYRGLKVAAIYGGGAALVISYMSNNKNYHLYLHEVQVRTETGQSPLGSTLALYDTAQLITAKEVYRRNREVVIFSLIGVYAVNVIDAYVDARLKYFDVGDNLAFKVSPSVISPNTMLYGYNSSSYVPAVKIALRF